MAASVGRKKRPGGAPHRRPPGGAETGPGGRGILDRVVPGYQEARIVLTACRLDVFETLGEGPADAASLAARLRLPSDRTAILLDALTALGLLVKRRGRYAPSATARRHLLPGGPGYQGDLLRHQERMWDHWTRLGEALGSRAGRAAGSAADREFVLAMEANALRLGPKVVEAVDLEGVRRLLDLGGGPGTWARLFHARRPGLRVTVMERGGIAAVVRSLGLNRGLGGAIRYRCGDFLRDPLGTGYDAVWASNVLHALPPEGARRLLGRAWKALLPGGRLLVHDFFLGPSGTRPRRAAVFSVHMLAVTGGGRTYRLDETLNMLVGAGFEGARLVASFGDRAVLEARRPR